MQNTICGLDSRNKEKIAFTTINRVNSTLGRITLSLQNYLLPYK